MPSPPHKKHDFMIVTSFSDTDEHIFSQAERELIREVAIASEYSVRMLLPRLIDRIELTVKAGAIALPEIGAIGATIGRKGRVVCTVDPACAQGMLAMVQSQLRPMLFHELNHVMRKQGQSKLALSQRTLLDFAASEGLATTFERDEGGGHPPWGQYPPEVHRWVAEIMALPADAAQQPWMFRHPDGRRWIGYKAGTYLVDRAVSAARLSSSAELVEAPTARIFELAGFEFNDRSAIE